MANGNGNGNGQANTGLNDALHRMIAAVAQQYGGNVPPGVFAGNPPGTPGISPQMGAALGGAPWGVPPGVLGAQPPGGGQMDWTGPPGVAPPPSTAVDYTRGGAGIGPAGLVGPPMPSDPRGGAGAAYAANPYIPGGPQNPFPPSPAQAVPGPGGAMAAPGQQPGAMPPGMLQPLPQPYSGQLQGGTSFQPLGAGQAQPLPGQGVPPALRQRAAGAWGASGGVPYRYTRDGSQYNIRGYPGGGAGLTQRAIPQGVQQAALRQQAGTYAPPGVPGMNMQIPKMPTLEDAFKLAGKMSQPFYATAGGGQNVAKVVDPRNVYNDMLASWRAQTEAMLKMNEAAAARQAEAAKEAEERAREAREEAKDRATEAHWAAMLTEKGREADIRTAGQAEKLGPQATAKAIDNELKAKALGLPVISHPDDARQLGLKPGTRVFNTVTGKPDFVPEGFQ